MSRSSGIVISFLLVFIWSGLGFAENPVRVFVSVRDAPEAVSEERNREAYDELKNNLELADERYNEAIAEMKAKYGKKRKLWPLEEKENVAERHDIEIEQAYHRYHITANEKRGLEGSAEFIRKYFTEGHPVGPGELSSDFEVVRSSQESNLQVEVMGRHIREGFGTVTCVRVSFGDQFRDDRLTIERNPWKDYRRGGPLLRGFYVTTVIHEYSESEPYWLIHQSGGEVDELDYPKWRESCAEVTRLIDWFVQEHPDLF